MRKKKEKKEKLSWKESFQLNNRAFRLLQKECPQAIVSRLACRIWEALSPYAGIYLSAQIIEELAGMCRTWRLKELVLLSLGLAAAISLISALLHKWEGTVSSGFHFQREQIFSKKMMEMDFADIDDIKTRDLLSTLQQTTNSGGWGLSRVEGAYENLVSSIATLLGGISLSISLFTSKVPEEAGGYRILNHPLFLVAVVGIMLAVTYLAPALQVKAGSYWAKNSSTHNLSNRLFSFFGFLGHEQQYALDMRIYQQDLICDKHNSGKTGAFHSKGMFAKLARGPMGFYYASAAAVSVLFTGFAYLFVCLKAWAGAFGIGAVTQYIGAITKFSGGISSLISTTGDMRNNAPFLKQTFDFLDIPNRMYQGSLTVEKRSDKNYEVEFCNVSFRYPGSEAYALKNVSLKFRIGERLAVVGQNGSGKTTFIKLLCRLYDPTEGEILLNGIDIRKYNYCDYMSIFSIVFQDFSLFSFQLGQNVATEVSYDRELATDCLVKAGFGERLKEWEDGLDTYLYRDFFKTGVNISGGEAQKIAIARSLYKDAAFIVLDEPTAALDPIAEAEIYEKFNEIVGNKTGIYISHRLSSCRFCDDIVVFDEGSIVQKGSHEELLAKENGKYHKLWHAQAQYYTE